MSEFLFFAAWSRTVPVLCPGHHELGDCVAKSKLMPYFAQVCAESLLILHLIYMGMDNQGPLPFLLKTAINNYHMNETLAYAELMLDLGTDKKYDQWKVKIQKFTAKLGMHKSK
ncbi:hypothetical protein V8B97DRAFT_1915821 [Scleroderma yunnanense]